MTIAPNLNNWDHKRVLAAFSTFAAVYVRFIRNGDKSVSVPAPAYWDTCGAVLFARVVERGASAINNGIMVKGLNTAIDQATRATLGAIERSGVEVGKLNRSPLSKANEAYISRRKQLAVVGGRNREIERHFRAHEPESEGGVDPAELFVALLSRLTQNSLLLTDARWLRAAGVDPAPEVGGATAVVLACYRCPFTGDSVGFVLDEGVSLVQASRRLGVLDSLSRSDAESLRQLLSAKDYVQRGGEKMSDGSVPRLGLRRVFENVRLASATALADHYEVSATVATGCGAIHVEMAAPDGRVLHGANVVKDEIERLEGNLAIVRLSRRKKSADSSVAAG